MQVTPPIDAVRSGRGGTCLRVSCRTFASTDASLRGVPVALRRGYCDLIRLDRWSENSWRPRVCFYVGYGYERLCVAAVTAEGAAEIKGGQQRFRFTLSPVNALIAARLMKRDSQGNRP